jgi:predicted acetyltransferase
MPSVGETTGPALVLRPPTMGDEEQVRAGHAELTSESFPYLFHPELSWGEQLDRIDREARGVDLPPGRVRAEFLVAEVGSDLVGRVSLRHSLTPLLLEIGGHVGYAVRPAFRGRGYATAMLRQSLHRLAALGVTEVLVTCDDDNLASATVIERCGGVLEDVRRLADEAPPTRRYWIRNP